MIWPFIYKKEIDVETIVVNDNQYVIKDNNGKYLRFKYEFIGYNSTRIMTWIDNLEMASLLPKEEVTKSLKQLPENSARFIEVRRYEV